MARNQQEKAPEEKANYEKTTEELDLEVRRSEDYQSPAVLSTADNKKVDEDDLQGRDYRVEGNDTEGYLNVSPEYMTYADETHKPGLAEEGVYKELEEEGAGVAYNVNPIPEETVAKFDDEGLVKEESDDSNEGVEGETTATVGPDDPKPDGLTPGDDNK